MTFFLAALVALGLPASTALRATWSGRVLPHTWTRMSTEPEAMPNPVPPAPQNLYVAEREDFEATADLVDALQADALRAVNKLQLGVLLSRDNVREFDSAVRENMQEKAQLEGLREQERIVLYANDLFQLSQRPIKLGALVAHMALAAVLMPPSTEATLVVKAQMTAIRRIAMDTGNEGAKQGKLVAGRLLLLFSLAPFPEGYLKPGLATDAMGVFLNVRQKEERAKARSEAAKEGWERVLDSIVRKPTQSGQMNGLPDEAFYAWEATARAITKHALSLLEPDPERTTYALAMAAREQADRAMNAQAAHTRAGKEDLAPLSRGLAVLRLYVELMVLINELPPSPNSFFNVAKDFLKGAAVSSGLGGLRTFALFARLFMAEILEGKRVASSTAGSDCMVLSQILGMSPMDITRLGRDAFEAEVGAAAAQLADDPNTEMRQRANWATALSLLTIHREYWPEVLEESLRPIVQAKLAAGVDASALVGDAGVQKAGAFLGFDEGALDLAVQKQVRENLAELVRELRGEVSTAVREATASLGIGKGLDPDELPGVTEEGVQEVLEKVRALGLSVEDAQKVIVAAAREEMRALCTEALKLEQERNVKGGALMLVRGLGLATGLVRPLLEALHGNEDMTDREVSSYLALRAVLSEQQEMAVSELGWGMRQDPAFERVGQKIMVLFGMV